jgi:hypothetical protein
MLATATLHVNKFPDHPGWLRFDFRPEGTVWKTVGPVQPIYPKKVSETFYTSLVRQVNRVLRESGPTTAETEFVALGGLLYNNLIPDDFRELLRSYTGTIDLWTNEVAIPWELVYDGGEFWGRRYAIGRTIRIPSEKAPVPRPTPLQARLSFLLIAADPLGDLPAVEEELQAIERALPGTVSTTTLCGPSATDIAVLIELNRGVHDVIHYSGHVVVDPVTKQSALLLDQGQLLLSSTIRDNLHGRPVVFVNGCRPVPDEEYAAQWEVGAWDEMNRDISNGFIFGGAIGIIATLNRVGDRQAKEFATHFYTLVLEELPLGEALRRARLTLIEGAGWASFVLFGDPNLSLKQRIPKDLGQESTPESRQSPASGETLHVLRSRELAAFTREGRFNPACFDTAALYTLTVAAAEMQSLGDKQVQAFHLFMSMTRGKYFESLFSHLTDHRDKALILALKLLRASVRHVYNRPIIIEVGDVRARELLADDVSVQVKNILHTAQGLAHQGPVQEQHLLHALLRHAPADLLQILEQSGVTISEILKRAGGASLSSFKASSSQHSQTMFTRLLDALQQGSRDASATATAPHPLFTPEGRLEAEKLAEGVEALLRRGVGYEASQGQVALLTPSLLLALLDNAKGVVSAALRVQGIEPGPIRQKLGGDGLSSNPQPVTQSICSERVLRILQRACEYAEQEGVLVHEAHLLLGLLVECEGPTTEILKECGVDLDRLQASCKLN